MVSWFLTRVSNVSEETNKAGLDSQPQNRTPGACLVLRNRFVGPSKRPQWVLLNVRKAWTIKNSAKRLKF